jgi:hypothetical protein
MIINDYNKRYVFIIQASSDYSGENYLFQITIQAESPPYWYSPFDSGR